MVVTMWILKTFVNPRQQYLECEYRNIYPTYWLDALELDIWSTGMAEDFRKHIPIGYTHENT